MPPSVCLMPCRRLSEALTAGPVPPRLLGMGLTVELTDDEVRTIEEFRDSIFYTNAKDAFLAAYDRAKAAQSQAPSPVPQTLPEAKAPEVPRLWGSCFPKGENIVLAAESGTGKSFLSIELIKSPQVKKALVILLDDFSETQHSRFASVIQAGRVVLLSPKQWEAMTEEITQELQTQAALKAYAETQTPPAILDLLRRFEAQNKALGIKDQKTPNNFMVLERFLRSDAGQGIDLICIDSLTDFLGVSMLSTKSPSRSWSVVCLHRSRPFFSFTTSIRAGKSRVSKIS